MSEEDKKLLLEMKSNCLETRETKKITYNDEKRIKKAKAIDNALKEIERLNNIINELNNEIEKNPQLMNIPAILDFKNNQLKDSDKE